MGLIGIDSRMYEYTRMSCVVHLTRKSQCSNCFLYGEYNYAMAA